MNQAELIAYRKERVREWRASIAVCLVLFAGTVGLGVAYARSVVTIALAVIGGFVWAYLTWLAIGGYRDATRVLEEHERWVEGGR